MQDTLARLRQLWQDTSRTNQVLILASVVAVLFVGIGFVYWAGTPEYKVLVSNASPENQNKILNKLKERKVAYRVSNGAIEVPAADADELSIALAGDGLLESGSQGWGILEKAPFGQTQAMEQETIRHAHEVAMEGSIARLDPVASATVHFTDGDKNELFDPDKKEGAASVIVRVKPGRELTNDNVRAIVALVQSGYSNIPARNINVVDGQGHLRWNGSDEASGAMGAEEREAQENRKAAELTSSLQGYLDGIIGPGKSTVMVRTTLDLDRRTKRTHEIMPGVVTQKTSHVEELKGGAIKGGRAIGQPGMASNTSGAAPPSYRSGDVSTPSGNYSNTETQVTTTPGISDTESQVAPGEIKSAAVMVTVDKKVPTDTFNGLKRQIETFMGANQADGGPIVNVSVEAVDFDRSAVEADKKAADAAASSERINKLLGYGVPLALMVVMLFILARSLRRPAGTAPQLAVVGGRTGLALGGAQVGAGGLNVLVGANGAVGEGVGMSVEDALGEPKIVPVGADNGVHTYEVISEQFDANLESVVHLSKSKPETVAALIKTWMTEEKR